MICLVFHFKSILSLVSISYFGKLWVFHLKNILTGDLKLVGLSSVVVIMGRCIEKEANALKLLNLCLWSSCT